MARKAEIYRKTTETEVSMELGLDGTGEGKISTTVAFMDHMLSLFARHGLVDLIIKSHGDTQVDDHHLVEDIGICLGDAVKKALGDKKGIQRYGSAMIPMDESLCSLVMDISGRPYLIYNVEFKSKKSDKFDYSLLREFFKSFSDHSGITLHINLLYGKNNHHIAEAIFKALALALRKAVTIHGRIEGILSTKGSL
ncbi:MAG: imidazoleglycerol-phosphate dehydratase HisB [Deltaproteobacteria bacterium]|nr:MAG: imidazoleglycerol-phosphate dehydratase HisB [Deltaproteobacteria bacterium]